MRLFNNGKTPPTHPQPPEAAVLPIPTFAMSPPSFDQLLDDRHRLDAEIRRRQDDELIALKRRINALAAALGMSVTEVLGLTSPTPKKEEKKPRQAKPKYQHPTEPLLWSGRGKPPYWMQDLLDGGANKSEFLMDKN